MRWFKHANNKDPEITISYKYACEIACRITGCHCPELYANLNGDKELILEYAMSMPEHDSCKLGEIIMSHGEEKRDMELQERIEQEENAMRAHRIAIEHLEEEYLKPNATIDRINVENKEIIERRIAIIKEATSFVANANKELASLALGEYLKCYKEGAYFYVISYSCGSYMDIYPDKCLRGFITLNDNIKEYGDLYGDKDPVTFDTNKALLRPLLMLSSRTLLNYYKFLPDFYDECLKHITE